MGDFGKSNFATNKSLLFWNVLGFFHTSKNNGIGGYGEETYVWYREWYICICRTSLFFFFFLWFLLLDFIYLAKIAHVIGVGEGATTSRFVVVNEGNSLKYLVFLFRFVWKVGLKGK